MLERPREHSTDQIPGPVMLGLLGFMGVAILAIIGGIVAAIVYVFRG